jgi:hypothetical protein
LTLEIGISDEPGSLEYYSFEEPAFNTFDHKLADTRDSKILSRTLINVYRLSEILNEHLNSGQQIDFMSVDVEGHDLQVLRSNDWKRFRPKYILAESLRSPSVYETLQSDLSLYMASVDYILFAKTVNTLFFADGKR